MALFRLVTTCGWVGRPRSRALSNIYGGGGGGGREEIRVSDGGQGDALVGRQSRTFLKIKSPYHYLASLNSTVQ